MNNKEKIEQQVVDLDRRKMIKNSLISVAATGASFAPAIRARAQANLGGSLAPPVIDSVMPTTVGEGDMLTITGSGFGTREEDICNLIVGGGQTAVLRARTATDTEVTSELGFLPGGMASGQLVVTRGSGDNVVVTPPAGLEVDDIWTWGDIGIPSVVFPDVLTLTNSANLGLVCEQGWSCGNPGDSFMQLDITYPGGVPASCDPGSRILISADFRVNDPGGLWNTTSFQFDQWERLNVILGSPLALCLAAACDIFEDVFLTRSMPADPTNNISCSVVISGNTVTFFLQLPAGITFQSGCFSAQLCLM